MHLSLRLDLQYQEIIAHLTLETLVLLLKAALRSSADPRGFDEGDAGKGAYIDGSVAGATSLEATMLFHSATFITPGVDAITVTNGARVEWLNSFTYFANRGIYGVNGATGLRGTGQTAIRVSDLTGTILDGNTFSYYDTDGTTVLATGTINGVDADGKFYVDGNLTGLETAGTRGGKTVTSYNNASLETSVKKFGTSSLSLDGVDDYVGVASNNDFGFSTEDFTVEGWIYPTTSSFFRSLFDFRAGTVVDDAVAVYLNGSNQPYLYVTGSIQIQSTVALNLNAWNHIAYVRQGTTGTLYLNGISRGTWTDNTDYGVAKPLVIGAQYNGLSYFFEGNIDELRISKGIARYSGATLIVPLSEFVSDGDTVLLLHMNGEDSSNVIVDDTLNSQDIRF